MNYLCRQRRWSLSDFLREIQTKVRKLGGYDTIEISKAIPRLLKLKKPNKKHHI